MVVSVVVSIIATLCKIETTQDLDDNRMPPETTNVAAIYNAPFGFEYSKAIILQEEPWNHAEPTTNAPGRLVSLV
jgi:hypothetical protein